MMYTYIWKIIIGFEVSDDLRTKGAKIYVCNKSVNMGNTTRRSYLFFSFVTCCNFFGFFLAIKQTIAYSARSSFDDKEKLIKQGMSFNDNFKCFKYISLVASIFHLL